MDLGLKNKRVLVGGSSSGIGYATAELFAAEGAHVVLVARNEANLAAAAQKLRQSGATIDFVAADLSMREGVDHVAAHVLRDGEIDVLVNNAGGPRDGLFSTLSDSDWADAFHLTLMATVRLTRSILPGMARKKWGRVINISSTSVKQPIDGLMLSNSIRMAVVGFAKTLADEVGGANITVNTVAPGYTGTDRLADLAESTAKRTGKSVKDVEREWAERVPLKRIGEPREIAAAVVFLASEAASYVNGVVLPVDGGRLRTSM